MEEKILKVLEEIRDIQKENMDTIKSNRQEIQKLGKRFLICAFVLIAAFLFLTFLK